MIQAIFQVNKMEKSDLFVSRKGDCMSSAHRSSSDFADATKGAPPGAPTFSPRGGLQNWLPLS